MRLYHGTNAASSIMKNGFDLSHISENKGNFGAMGIGVYCATWEQTAYSYGNECIIVEIDDDLIQDFDKSTKHLDLAEKDGFDRWDASVDRSWSEKISKEMRKRGIKATMDDSEVCVYDPSIIKIVEYANYMEYRQVMDDYN